jgi:hypothetical protein
VQGEQPPTVLFHQNPELQTTPHGDPPFATVPSIGDAFSMLSGQQYRAPIGLRRNPEAHPQLPLLQRPSVSFQSPARAGGGANSPGAATAVMKCEHTTQTPGYSGWP